jgi:transaldolase / glucose-6-phosphate isomerase
VSVEADAVRVDLDLPEELAAAVERRLEAWSEEGFAERLWWRDPTLWAKDETSLPPELADRLGWLGLPERALEEAAELAAFAGEVRADGAERVVLMGMGGSSLAPEVFQAVLGCRPGYLELVLLDSTHPGAVAAVRAETEPTTTIYVVASKSGTTAETMSFFHYFWRETEEALGASAEPGSRFVAITDPGTPLADLAAERSFRRVFLAPPDVGGRYSALSVFGLVPAALVGLDVARLARGARDFGETALRHPAADNPGLRLAAAMAEAARLDPPRDALTFRVAPSLVAFPVWIEQLVAESLGKGGTGVLPVVDEPTRELDAYGPDRVFLRMGLREEIEADDAAPREGGREILRRITDAGHPVVTVTLADRWSLGAAMLLWEVATAAAGAALGVQPFDQPDVELAKVRGREALAGGATGTGGVDEVSTDDLKSLARALEDWSRAGSYPAGKGSHPTGERAAPYVAIQAFLPPDPRTDHALRDLRAALAERLDAVTTVGYGPRFLHSTGQLHKGGPDTGLFLQLVDDAEGGPAIPDSEGGSEHGFGDLVRAQALGDYRALAERGRRVLRVRLGGDRYNALGLLRTAVGAHDV